MSTTVTYKGNTLATVSNNIKTLKTAGKYMEGDVTLTDTSSTIVVSETLDANGGIIKTITTTDEVNLQTKTITPTSSVQTVNPDTGYDGFSQVIVNAGSEGGSGGVDFEITLTQDSNENWTPDCTYAEVIAAYNNGKTIIFTAEFPAVYTDFNGYDEFDGIVSYVVVESFLTSFNDDGLNEKVYHWHYNDNIDLDSSNVYYITNNANAQPSDVVKDKVFYNADGYQVGTATGSIPTIQSLTVTPTTSQQTFNASGVDGYKPVTVEAMPAMTLPTSAASSATSGYTSKATIGRSTAAQYINIPPGYNSTGAYYVISAVANGSATGPTSLSGSSATITTGTNTITLTKTGVSTTPTVSAGYVSSATASTATVALTASVTVNPTPTASGATVTIPAGYYSSQTTKSVTSGSATAPASISGTAASVSTGTNTLTLTKTVSVTPTVSAGYVSAGTAGNSSVSLTASVTTKAAATITPTTTNQTIAAGTYLTGTQTIAGDADLVGSNILSTANIFGVQGTVDFIDVYIRSTAPTSSVGSDGDIYIQE